MHADITKSVKPWYRQFWPWFLISFPFFSIIAGSVIAYYAVHGRDTLVVDNYYKEGLEINEVLDKDNFAASIALTADVLIDDKDVVKVQLHSKEKIAPDFLEFKLLHPTLAGRDQKVKLTATGNLSYQGKLEHTNAGRWYINIEDDQNLWRLKDEVWLPHKDALVLVGGSRR